MTKLKNTKKGMAKKALSISLVAAMLATSNVPVWAAEDLFSDGSAAVVEEFSEETPVVEEEITASPLSSVVTSSDITVDLTVSASTVTWGDTATVSGSIIKKEDGSKLTSWKYRWLDENNISVKNGSAVTANDMNIVTDGKMAGKTLTLYVYDDEGDANYDINTGITVKVEKRALKSATYNSISPLEYNGFAQSINVENIVASITDSKNESVNNDAYTVTSTSAINANDTVTVTVTAKEDSAYKGTLTKTYTIGTRPYKAGDILADVTKGLSFQYTGSVIEVPTDKVTLKESKSENNGTDDKLNGNELSSAIKNATTSKSSVGDTTVKVATDANKLTNFKSVPSTIETETTVEITKRDLSTAGTVVSVKNGKIPTTATTSNLASYLTFKGTEGTDLNLNGQYSISVKDPEGNVTSTLDKVGTYSVTITAKEGSNCKGTQTFDVTTVKNVLSNVEASNIKNKSYAPVYTGSAITPSKEDLGSLTVSGTSNTETLQASEWEILGYKNNTDAATYKGEVGNSEIKTQAYVTIKVLSGTYKDETYDLPFVIQPLEVTGEDITVPKTIAYNENYTKVDEYKIPVSVVAKSKDKKVVKALTADDYTVTYTGNNKLNNFVTTKITITNKNYILGSKTGTTHEVTADIKTQLVATPLTDAMIHVNPDTYTYTGGKITPDYVVLDGALVLYKDQEYKEVSITDAVNVGTGKITIEGINNQYSGTASATFQITPANTSSVKVEIADQDYTGRQVRPRKFKATLNGNDVTSQFEIVSYGANVEAGKGTVVLQPKSTTKNFTGDNITAEFNIVKEQVRGTLTAYDEKGIEYTQAPVFEFDGNEKTLPKVVLSGLVKKDGTKTTATADDFEIKYVDNVSGKGTGKNVAYVYAIAKEGTGFSGYDTITTADGTVIKGVVAKYAFYIDSVQFVKQNITVTNGTYAAGLPVKPEILIQIGGTTLVEDKDYTVQVAGGTTYTDVTNGKVYDLIIKGINGYAKSGTITLNDSWGIDKKDLADCTVTAKDGVVTVLNGYIPVPTTEYTVKENEDKTYTVTANKESKNYTGSKTVVAEGQKPEEGPEAPVISEVKVVGNKATVVLSGESDGATGYDYVISTVNNYTDGRLPNGINKNQLSTETSYQYLDQGIYYAYCHAWKRVNGVKVFSEWSNIYPFAVNTITPEKPVITKLEKSSNGKHLRVTWTKSANATGYDVVMGTKVQKVNGEYRPVEYGKAVKKVTNGDTVSVIFYNVPKGTYYVGLHAYNRTSDTGVKVFSPWSNSKKVTF